MNKIFKFAALLACTALLTVSCEEEATQTVYSPSPNSLNSGSEISTVLQSVPTGEYECVAINYPITMLSNLASYQTATEHVIENDQELLEFFANLTSTETYAIQYPLSVTGFSANGEGEIISINSNTQFMTVLQSEIAQCMAYYTCDTANTIFQQAYAAIKADTDVTEEFTMDLFTHEYTFSASEDGSICSIGYMGEDDAIEYLVEIVDADGMVLYSGLHMFSDTEMEYISIPHVDITAGDQYTIRRSIESYDVGQGIGTILIGPADTLPATTGIITIHHSRFYGGGGNMDPVLTSVPKIDFVFKPL